MSQLDLQLKPTDKVFLCADNNATIKKSHVVSALIKDLKGQRVTEYHIKILYDTAALNQLALPLVLSLHLETGELKVCMLTKEPHSLCTGTDHYLVCLKKVSKYI